MKAPTGGPHAKIVGKTAPVGPRMGYEVYEANRPHECHYCERSIGIGERFTRRMDRGWGPRRWPVCSDCEDAVVEDPEGESDGCTCIDSVAGRVRRTDMPGAWQRPPQPRGGAR